MTTAEINLALALIIWAMASAVSVAHLREFGWRHMSALLGVFVWVAATLLLLTAAGGFMGDMIETLRLAAAFLRGVLLALIVAYSWDHWIRHRET